MDTVTNWISPQSHWKKKHKHRDNMGCSVKNVPCILFDEIAYHTNFILNSLKVQMRLTSVSIFPRSPALYSLTRWLSFPLTRHVSPSPHPAKPIRDLRASPPINYDPNQCRGLWYRIICQISADGWGQVPLCYRPYPCGNLCSGWALLMLPNLLMESHFVRQDCSPAAWSPRLLVFKHLSQTADNSKWFELFRQTEYESHGSYLKFSNGLYNDYKLAKTHLLKKSSTFSLFFILLYKETLGFSKFSNNTYNEIIIIFYCFCFENPIYF